MTIRGSKVSVNLVDTGDEERYGPIPSSYFSQAAGVIIVYDASASDSIEQLEPWVSLSDKFSTMETEMSLVGTHSDLQTPKDAILVEQRIAGKYNVPHWYRPTHHAPRTTHHAPRTTHPPPPPHQAREWENWAQRSEGSN
eukprot:TRINITY_DN2098_c0_g1_i1.p1 TRINITY_DN2098_c0_g1~~TRINITY_DN2098_c0_g1_i1.p1  ORF type:complete len:140 (-),score=13.60 TRINITY_DN2098_c0_g1_i1:165-584(-)